MLHVGSAGLGTWGLVGNLPARKESGGRWMLLFLLKPPQAVKGAAHRVMGGM